MYFSKNWHRLIVDSLSQPTFRKQVKEWAKKDTSSTSIISKKSTSIISKKSAKKHPKWNYITISFLQILIMRVLVHRISSFSGSIRRVACGRGLAAALRVSCWRMDTAVGARRVISLCDVTAAVLAAGRSRVHGFFRATVLVPPGIVAGRPAVGVIFFGRGSDVIQRFEFVMTRSQDGGCAPSWWRHNRRVDELFLFWA